MVCMRPDNRQLNAQFSQSTSDSRWGDVVETPFKSKKAARDYFLLRKPVPIQNTGEWRALSVDLPLRYACCALESSLGLVVSLGHQGQLAFPGSSARRKRDFSGGSPLG